MDLKIVAGIKTINIVDEEDNILYDIPIHQLGDVINKNGTNYSSWINQLEEKTWINIDTLYELAQVIKELVVNNDIDWKETFFTVEKGIYLEHVKNVKKDTSNAFEQKTSYSDIVMRAIETGKEENNQNINKIVDEIVDKNLKRYDII